MVFEEVESGLWKPENSEDEIQGILMKVQEDVGANNSYFYTLEVEKKAIGVWGSTILDSKMLAAKIGDLIKIRYDGLGEAKAGHSAPKLFTVFIDRDTESEE